MIQETYEAPEVIELGEANELILGCNCYNCDCDQTDRDDDTESFL